MPKFGIALRIALGYPAKDAPIPAQKFVHAQYKMYVNFWNGQGWCNNLFAKIYMIESVVSHLRVPPHPMLRKHIAHYTFHLPSAVGHYTSKLMPDASGSIACLCHTWGFQLQLWGPSSQVFHAPVHSKSPLCFFVDFRPTGMHSLLKFLPLRDVSNKIIPLAIVDEELAVAITCTVLQRTSLGTTPVPLGASLTEVIAGSIPNLSALISKLDTIFLQRLASSGKVSIVDSLLHLILSSCGATRVTEAAKVLGYSSRHLNRLCVQQVGLSAKSFFRVVRINIACENLKKKHALLAGLAQDLGYYDQSHFIHDFTAICEVSPSQYLRDEFAFYSEPQKLSVTT